MIILTMALHFVCFWGCSTKKSKKKFFGSNIVCNNLIREKYVVGSWGALSAETYSDYLTDSINFRVYIGTHDEDENFEYDCSNDSIYVIRLSIKGIEKAKVIDTSKIYSLSELKRERIFE